MLTKEDLIKKLRNDPTYREALKMAKTDEERRRIIASAEGFLVQFVEAFAPIVAAVGKDKASLTQLREALNGRTHLINDNTNEGVKTDD